jgi:hypothetical protein
MHVWNPSNMLTVNTKRGDALRATTVMQRKETSPIESSAQNRMANTLNGIKPKNITVTSFKVNRRSYGIPQHRIMNHQSNVRVKSVLPYSIPFRLGCGHVDPSRALSGNRMVTGSTGNSGTP